MLTKSDFSAIQSILDTSRKETKEDLKILKKELKNDILDFKDSILSEIIKLREDMTVVVGYSDRIEDHDQRIEKLEDKIFA